MVSKDHKLKSKITAALTVILKTALINKQSNIILCFLSYTNNLVHPSICVLCALVLALIGIDPPSDERGGNRSWSILVFSWTRRRYL